ncbi:hypothetical protein MKW94_010076 [Papaver nudicaule]|uniref:Small ribosomal subunit protein mS41 SAM domain-containing protein n=1 Tax=Papaver nudicaule TaxID=74823 RepID=A0AA41SD76_PAPNU|nr:hypothetical protein [Papaver nudicaule]
MMMAWKKQLGSLNLFILNAKNVGIPEFLNGIGKGVETHVAKIETKIGDFHKFLVTRALKLEKLGLPVKHRKQLERTHSWRYKPSLQLVSNTVDATIG